MAGSFLQDLVVVMAIAAAMTLLFHRLRQPVVLGYLLAGVIIGPHTPPFSFITDDARVQDLAELGLVFLMFALGLEFNLRKLRLQGGRAVLMAFAQVSLMIALGNLAGRALGWDATSSLFLGAILASTSTTILVKVLLEMGLVSERFAQAAIAVTIFEDIFVLLVAVLLEGLGSGGMSLALVLTTLAQVVVFLLLVVSVGLVTVPRLMDWVGRQRVEELMVVAVVGVAFGGAFLASRLGFSLALGAFLAGALVSESRVAARITSRITPIRDLFASTFFVAVGMMLDPRLIWEHIGLVLLVAGLAVAGKFLANFLAGWLVGYDGETSARIGVAMAQMGEWSLIIAALGVSLGTTQDVLYPVAVGACSLTMLAAPHLLRANGRVAKAFAALAPTPLRGLTSAYHKTITRLEPGAAPGRDSRAAEGTSVRLAMYGAWVIGLFLAAAALLGWLEAAFPPAPLAANLRPAVGLTLVGLMGLPLLLVFGYEMSVWSASYAKRYQLRPQALSSARALSTRTVRKVAVVVAPVALYVLGLCIASVTVHRIDVPDLPVLLGVVLLLAAAAASLYPVRRRIHAWFNGALDLLLDAEPKPPRAAEAH